MEHSGDEHGPVRVQEKVVIPGIVPNLKRCLLEVHVHKSSNIKLGVGFLRN
jgi:hypothetical protein